MPAIQGDTWGTDSPLDPQSIPGGPRATEYYWRDDVDRTLAEWKALCAEHGGREPTNTAKELLEFKEEREAYVRDIQLVGGTPLVFHPITNVVCPDGE